MTKEERLELKNLISDNEHLKFVIKKELSMINIILLNLEIESAHISVKKINNGIIPISEELKRILDKLTHNLQLLDENNINIFKILKEGE